MKVAVGAAKGLTFLHEAKSQVIYRDFRSAKILLDAVIRPDSLFNHFFWDWFSFTLNSLRLCLNAGLQCQAFVYRSG